MRGDILGNRLGEKKQFGGERKGKEREKKEKEERKKKGKENKISAWEGEKEGRDKGESRPCTLQFLVFRRWEVNRSRLKVDLLDESYK